MMNDGNRYKAKVKRYLYRVQQHRFSQLILFDGKELIRKNPALAKVDLTQEEKEAVQAQWAGLRMKVSPLWHQIYKNLLGKFDPTWIPMSIFYLRYEPYLRDMRMLKAYSDKNAYPTFIPDANQPETIMQHIHNRYYGKSGQALAKSDIRAHLQAQQGDFFLKPAVDGNGGLFLTPFSIKKGRAYKRGIPVDFQDLLAPYPQNFIIQRKVVQHRQAAQLHPASVNTFRVTTIREGHDIRVLNHVMRVGVGGSQIDNTCKGGIVLGIYEGGRVGPKALDGRMNWLQEHPDTHVRFDGLKPFAYVKKVEAEAVRLHSRFPYTDMICWDLTYDQEDRVVVIEYNLGGFGVLFQQAFHGPYLGDKTQAWHEHMKEVWKHADRQTGYYPSLPRL